MSHDLDIKNGQARMAFNGEDPWHRLGVRVPDGENNLVRMLEAAQADYEVGIGRVVACDEHGEPLKNRDGSWVYVDSSRATYRIEKNGDMDGLATVGTRYKVSQHRALMERALAIVGAAEVLTTDGGGDVIYDGGLAVVETIGILDGGRRFFASIKLGDLNLLLPNGKEDRIGRYLGVLTSHDGKVTDTLCNNDVRWVCANTVAMGLAGAIRTFKSRHTEKGFLVEDAQAALGMSTQWSRELAKAARELGEISTGPARVDKVLATVFPLEKDATDRQKRNHDTIVTSIRNAYATDRNAGGFGENGWSLFNAVGEFLDHHRDGTADERALTSMDPDSWVTKKKIATRKAILTLV